VGLYDFLWTRARIILSGAETHTFGGCEFGNAVRRFCYVLLGLMEEAVVKKLILMATSLAMLPATAVLAVAQTETGSEVQGSITSISGSAVLVEENPADESGSAKGAFTVTGETEIFRSGDLQVPASFDDLRVGQPVIATYTGPVAESYPTQGTAGNIVILEIPADDQLLCLLPEGCDTNGDGLRDLTVVEPVPDEDTGAVQYDNAA
jgi:hypothetical protein